VETVVVVEQSPLLLVLVLKAFRYLIET